MKLKVKDYNFSKLNLEQYVLQSKSCLCNTNKQFHIKLNLHSSSLPTFLKSNTINIIVFQKYDKAFNFKLMMTIFYFSVNIF